MTEKFKAISFRGRRGWKYQIAIDVKPVGYERSLLGQLKIPTLAKLLAPLVEHGTLLDIGANIGTICVPCAVRGANVIAVEMLSDNCAKLKEAARLNNLKSFKIVQAAATDKNGSIGYTGDQAYACVRYDNDAPQVVAMTIDSILYDAEFKEPLVFKIDIEGHEYNALRGAEGTISRFRPVIVFESIELQDSGQNPKLVKKFLVERGYKLFLIDGYGEQFIARTPDDPQELVVSDFLAIPSEKMDEIIKRLDRYSFTENAHIVFEPSWLRSALREAYISFRMMFL